jgi:preprotein translocase subunit SecG
MFTFIVIIHVIVSISMILLILLQTGKGADIGAVFGGGGSNTLFGASGPTSFLSKLTAASAIVFMLTSLFLAYFAGNRPASSLMKGNVPAQQQPARGGVPGLPPGGMPPQGSPVPNPFQKGAPAVPAPAPAAPGK